MTEKFGKTNVVLETEHSLSEVVDAVFRDSKLKKGVHLDLENSGALITGICKWL